MQAIVVTTDPEHGEVTPRAAQRLLQVLDCGFWMRPTLVDTDDGAVAFRVLALEEWWADYAQLTNEQYWNWPGDQRDEQYQRGYAAREILDSVLGDVCWDDQLEAENFDRHQLNIFTIAATDTTAEERALRPDNLAATLGAFGISVTDDEDGDASGEDDGGAS